uniref:Mu transposase C-terminal domain-containing protein n=1 Tax=Devosia rhizosphaerae TaxID=3049774 RepID=UPI0025412A1B|nr:Mu transposase C-terminal domain-containing protein [Devosia sp. RR2S18]WIJ25210.1 Mu transposase C-terminal domain-containing protein [Devosia sp. RR2S18]
MDGFNSDRDLDDRDDDVYLRPGDGIELAGKQYVMESRVAKPRGFVFSDPAAPGVQHVMSNRDIKSWHRSGRLSFIAASEVGLPIGVQESLRRTMRAFKPEERDEIFRRLRYCLAISELPADFGRSKATLQPVCDAVAAKRNDTCPHHWSTVLRWWRTWVRAGKDPRALCPSTRRKGNRNRRLDDYKLQAMKRAIREHWNVRHRPSMTTAYKAAVQLCVDYLGGREAAEAHENPFPSLKAFRRECARQDRTTTLATRFGPEAARQAMHPVGMGPDVRLPYERVEADFKYLRIMVVDEKTRLPLGTPYLMAGFDCYSGCIAGFDIGFDPPSYVSAARCLKHIVEAKDVDQFGKDEDGDSLIRRSYPLNGVPQQFFLDQDAVFHSRSFEMSAKAIRCHVNYVPAGEAWKKGRIERFWRTVQQCFLDMFPGNVLRVGDGPGRDYNPVDDAVLTLSQLRLLITKAIVDVYHESIDEWTGKRHIDLWREAVEKHPPRPVRDHQSLIELVGAYEERVAERRGIRLFGLRYNSPLLAEYRSNFSKDPTVVVRYDPQDISRVWLIDEDRGLSLEVPCTRADYAEGLSLHQHRVIRRRAADRSPEGRLRMKQLWIAKAELFRLGEKMLQRDASRRTRKRIAQFLGVGRELIDEMSRRVTDEKASAEPLDYEDGYEDPGMAEQSAVEDSYGDLDDVAVEDPEDEAAALQDEAYVDSLREASKDKGNEAAPSRRKATVIASDPVAAEPHSDEVGSAEQRDDPASEEEPSSAVPDETGDGDDDGDDDDMVTYDD